MLLSGCASFANPALTAYLQAMPKVVKVSSTHRTRQAAIGTGAEGESQVKWTRDPDVLFRIIGFLVVLIVTVWLMKVGTVTGTFSFARPAKPRPART
jgi:hypothetical protein